MRWVQVQMLLEKEWSLLPGYRMPLKLWEWLQSPFWICYLANDLLTSESAQFAMNNLKCLKMLSWSFFLLKTWRSNRKKLQFRITTHCTRNQQSCRVELIGYIHFKWHLFVVSREKAVDINKEILNIYFVCFDLSSQDHSVSNLCY